MPQNSLARDSALKLGPVVLGTFVKHYFDRKKSGETADPDQQLKHDNIVYDETFNIIKTFLTECTFHTIEDVQAFSNKTTPVSPSTHVIRVLVPLSCCNEAADILIKALGGENKAREIVGGVKWWQVRGIEGVDGQWITAKKDWREVKRRRRMSRAEASPTAENHQPGASESPPDSQPESTYEKYMDEMRCMLYFHGGAYYFGSVDQERYSIQRHARKINGRVFAINYRLAPQYPFPCGLHDALAAYLYLTHPPPEADHRPIKPEHIVIAGDSAGGGMALALLQLLRDAGMPPPAGGVLISPWCDLTHSFPSVHTNTATDILPDSGISLHKPSTMWPLPPHEVTAQAHASLRQKLRHAFRMDESPALGQTGGTTIRTSTDSHSVPAPDMPVNVGENIPVPPVGTAAPQTLTLVTKDGERLEVDHQVHFYTQNSLLVHPLVSPGLGYLGGLPPLYILAGDKEVLRDEIIFTAHKAANPHKYPIKDQTKALYPMLETIQERHPQPTSVHLQVYDGSCHCMPVIFLFSTPAKFCFRAMANFVRLVTGMPLGPTVSTSNSSLFSLSKLGRRASSPEAKRSVLPRQADTTTPGIPEHEEAQPSSTSVPTNEPGSENNIPAGTSVSRKESLRRPLSFGVAMTDRVFRRQSRNITQESGLTSSSSGKKENVSVSGDRYAGESSVYEDIKDNKAFGIIRERVSIQGVIRPLEPESELDAFKVPEELLGMVSELAIRRQMTGEAHFRRKFAKAYKDVEKKRQKNLERMTKEEEKRFEIFRASSSIESELNTNEPRPKLRANVLQSPGWGYAWALDESEKPPPSSIVARRDTKEAGRLAMIADRAVVEEPSELNANSLWSTMMNILAPPDRMNGNAKTKSNGVDAGSQSPTQDQVWSQEKGKEKELKNGHRFSRIFLSRKSTTTSA